MDKDLEPSDQDPLEVLGLIKMESRLFAKTRWSSGKLHYVPYEFIREHYGRLLTTYFAKNAAPLDLSNKKKKKGA